MLKLIEYGANPSFLITGEEVQKLMNTNSSDVFTAQWIVMADTVLKTDEEIRSLREEIGDRAMTDHRLLAGGVAQVRYGEDLFLLVNYGDQPCTVNGTRVEPLSYALVKGGGAE